MHFSGQTFAQDSAVVKHWSRVKQSTLKTYKQKLTVNVKTQFFKCNT